jgi:hypothetical protein
MHTSIFPKLLALSFLSLFTFSLSAQKVQFGADTEEMINLKAGTLYVMAPAEYTDKLKVALTKYWKQCKFEFLTGDLESHLNTPSNYFLNVTSKEFGVFCGNKKRLTSYTVIDYLVLMDLPFDGDVSFDYIVNSINSAIDLVMSRQITGGISKMQAKAGEAITEAAPKLKGKTLLIIDKFVDKTRTSECILSKGIDACSMDHKVVTEEEAKKLMSAGDKKYCLLSFKIYSNGKTFMKMAYVYDFESRKAVYAFHHTSATLYSGFGPKDFARITDAMEGKKE